MRNLEFGAATGASEFETAQARGFDDKPGRLAQATTSDTDELQKALQQEHHRAELLARELTIARHLEMLLTLHQARAESPRYKQLSESEHAELRRSLQQERDRLKQAAESDAAELCQILPRDRADRSEQAAADGDAAELRKSLQQERDRSGRLEQDLAAAKREVAMQTALVAKANDNAGQLKQAAESGAAELRKSLDAERQRATQLEQDLAAGRRDFEAQTALAAKAKEDAALAKQTAATDVAELKQSLREARGRVTQLEQDFAAARRDVEAQTALASKTEEASQLKQVAENSCAELKGSLKKQRERADTLAQDLSMAHTTIYAYEAQARKASDQAADLKQAAESGGAELRKSLEQERERAGRLEQDLAAARRDVETQTALAAKANKDATQLKQVAESGSAELKRSLQKEHARAEALAQDLSLVHTAIYTYEVQQRKASDQAASRKQAEDSSAAELRKSLVQAWERGARLEQDLAAARRDAETQTALAAKAGAEAARLKQVKDDSSAGLLRSLQQERDRAARLERELASERKANDAPAPAGVTTSQVAQDKQAGADATRHVAKDQATVAAARGVAQPRPESAAEVARLVARASALLGQGDIGSARIVLERAVETGSAQASFALAETYDPLVLNKWGAYGTRGDAAKARDLYAKAQAGGMKEAKERLDALRR